MLQIKQIHHIAIIATDYQRSKAFYCDVLGFELLVNTIALSAIHGKAILALMASIPLSCSHFLRRRARQRAGSLRAAPSGVLCG